MSAATSRGLKANVACLSIFNWPEQLDSVISHWIPTDLSLIRDGKVFGTLEEIPCKPASMYKHQRRKIYICC